MPIKIIPEIPDLKSPSLPIWLLISAVLLASCTSLFAAGQIETQRGQDNTKIHTTWIGDSKTTTIHAVLDSRNRLFLSYDYSDSYALIPERITIDTDAGRNVFKPGSKTTQEIAEGRIRETGRIDVSRTLLEQMSDSDTPVIYIQGQQGTIIIKMGTQGKKNLRDLLNFK